MTTMTVIGHLARHAQANPESLAVACGAREISYNELWSGALLAADLLRDEGVNTGDRVMVAALREPEFLYAYFACHILHAIVVPYDPDIAPIRFRSIAEDLCPCVIVTNHAKPIEVPGCSPLTLGALKPTDSGTHSGRFTEPTPDQVADVLLTSGTTGKPKMVMLTHRNIFAAARNINLFIGNTAEDREALALPLYHSFGLGRVRCQILAGGALVLTHTFRFPKQMFEAMRSRKVTGFSFVPAAWAVLTRLTGDRLSEFSGSFRYIEIGSAPLPRLEKERLMRLFPHTRICMHYGLTEASRSAFIEFHQSKERLDSIGRPTPNVEIRIIDEEGRELESHRIGRIQVRGQHVATAYWDKKPQVRLEEGWLSSGDLGYYDEAGYFYVCGREDDQINIGGRKVHPMEIEEALLGHEDIAEALCIGTPDPITGEALCALVVPKPGRTELPDAKVLARFLRGTVEQYKIPVAFKWVSSLPMNTSGKIKRKEAVGLMSTPATTTGGV